MKVWGDFDMLVRQPLPASFMLIGMFGFIISIVYTYSGKLSTEWGFLFILMSIIFFIASMRSIRPTKDELEKMK